MSSRGAIARETCAVMLVAAASAVACGRPSAGEGAPPAARLHGLTVAVNGSGKVSSTPQGIDCGAVCAATFDEGVSVVFNAHPLRGPCVARPGMALLGCCHGG